MIKIDNISKSFGQDYIFENLSFVINKKDKLGIVGRNGVGKTTLLKCIVDNEEFLNSGDVSIQGTYAVVDQVTFLDEEISVYEEFLNIFPKLKKLKEELDDETIKNNHNLYVEKESLYNDLGGYDFKNKINKFMTGFSFKKEDINKKLKEFSGGEKTKLALIKILLLEPDYLFLDEPTNHLDIDAINWLESYLKSLKKGIILISHDKVFLNNVCNRIVELENKSIKNYNMTYDNYVKQKELNYKVEVANYQKQQKLIKKYEDFIIKNNKTPSKIGQVNDRKAKLSQLENLKKPEKIEKKLDFIFEGYHLKKATYIDFFDLEISFGNKTLIKNFNYKVYAQDKLAILGKNGVGKSSLFKAILNKEYTKGKIKIPSNIKIGYFDQEQKLIDKEKTLFDVIYDEHKFDSQSAIRKYLAKFLFLRDDVYKKIRDLSGGERVRITLAKMALEKYDILLLDEPTNHLDLETKDILINALKEFPSSILFISHDRDFIQKVSNKIIEIEEGNILNYSSYEEYKNYKENYKKEQTNKRKSINKEKNTNKKSNNSINMIKLNLIEEDILKYEEEKEKELALLTKEDVIKNYEHVNEIKKNIEKIEKKLEELYEQYEKTIK